MVLDYVQGNLLSVAGNFANYSKFRDTLKFAMIEEVLRYDLSDTTQLFLKKGDITVWEGGAIVNAANEVMLGGGGVDGAIHEAAGPDLKVACLQISKDEFGSRCPVGDAKITEGGNLKAEYVIHTVGPVYHEWEDPDEQLYEAYRKSLELAKHNGVKTIALPAISCGIYGYPLDDAADIAIAACLEHAGDIEEIHFILYGNDTMEAFARAVHRIFDIQGDMPGE